MAIEAPVIKREMDDWVTLGGRDLGIVGDANHNKGFHRGADEVDEDDYSRRRDPNGSDGPFVNWSYACAGDFAHDFKPHLLVETRRVLKELRTGQHPEVCEFIGKPWADRPVIYCAVWNNWRIQNYTGSGHDRWNHIAWFRSRVNVQSNLWRPTMFCRFGDTGSETVRFYQRVLKYVLRFYNGNIDGDYGPVTRDAVKKMMEAVDPDDKGLEIGDQEAIQAHRQLAKVEGGGVSRAEMTDIVKSVFEANKEELRGPAGKTPSTIVFETVGKVVESE